MTGSFVYPTADQVAYAIVAACRLCDDDPIRMAEGLNGLRREADADLVVAAIPTGAPAHAVPTPSQPRLVATIEADATGAPAIAIQTNAGVLRAPAPTAPVEEKVDDRIVRRGPPLKPKPLPLRAPHRSTASLLEEAARGLGIPVVVKPLPPGARRVMPHVASPGDQTSSLLGDPPPGRSALDHRQPRE